MNYKFLITLFALSSQLLISAAQAQIDEASKSFHISGYGTLGAVHSSSNQVDFVRSLLQRDGVGYSRSIDFGMDSLLGLQLDLRPADEFGASIQAVSRRGQSEFQPELTWAYARYTPNDTVQMRAGRLGFDVYLLADSRDVGYSYQWVRPPIEYFGPLTLSYLDGADAVLKTPLSDGVLRAKLYVGKAREKPAIGGNYSAVFPLTGSPLLGAYLEYQNQHWQFRAGGARLRFNNEFPQMQELADALRSPSLQYFDPNAAALADRITFKDKTVDYLSAGVAYDNGPLQAQLMLSKLKSDLIAFPQNIAGYTTISYRLKQWTPYITYSAIRPNTSTPVLHLPPGIDPNLDAIAHAYRVTSEGQLADQSTVSLGLRYDFAEKMDLKFQIDHIRSKQNLLLRNVQPSWNGRATLFSIAFDFVF
ncbi:hypothetical protein [Undibacterium sp. Ren11W]|uniref:hypothetical protein n=1 Tax=Undibacterium sp. Ren11W TaxID=3413045 RepID=UPI003BF02D46